MSKSSVIKFIVSENITRRDPDLDMPFISDFGSELKSLFEYPTFDELPGFLAANFYDLERFDTIECGDQYINRTRAVTGLCIGKGIKSY